MASQLKKFTWAGVAVFALGAASGWSAPMLLHAAQSGAGGSTADGRVAAAQAVATSDSTPIASVTAPNYRAIVAQNEAAVVGISVEGRMQVSSPAPDFGLPFGLVPFGERGNGRPPNVPMHGQGSGFIISADGLVLTNAHVVKGADTVTVKLTDHREFKAKVLGMDPTSDIAVLRIDAQGLQTVRLGNSDALSVGDYVLAIGAPFGLEETATAGIVSAKGRSLPGDGAVPFIQTDAAVNPGNSGGPLFDASGAVVGINSQIYSSSGGYQGVAFAIPINLARQVETQIVKNGKVEHGRLGIEVQTLDQSLADSFKLKTPSGAVVSKVDADGAGARAGLKPGDVILKYDDVQIGDAGQLSARVSMGSPGDTATLSISRDGKPMTLTARLGSAGGERTADNRSSSDSDQARLGLALRPLSPGERDETGIDSGLVVEEAEGRAAAAGIQRGDVVLSVNGTPVRSVQQLRQLVHEHGRQVALLIQRGDNRIFVPVALG